MAGYLPRMNIVDGLYRHAGVSTIWESIGVMISHELGPPVGARWDQIIGVRSLGGSPGWVQLMVIEHVPAAVLADDPFSIPVASDADANRLMTSIGWQATGSTLTLREME